MTTTVRAEDRFRLLHQEAMRLSALGEIQKSIPYFEKMLELQPYNEEAKYLLACAYLYQENPGKDYGRDVSASILLLEDASRLQLSVTDRSENLGLRYFQLAMAYWMKGDLAQAISVFEKSYRADFQRLDAIYNRFVLYHQLGKPTEAGIELRRYQRLTKASGIDD